MTTGRRALAVGVVALVAAVAPAVAPGPAAAGFGATTTASHTVGTATLGPATSPAAARGSCVAALAVAITVSWSTSSLASGYQVRYGTTNGGPYGSSVAVTGGSTTSTIIGGLAFSTTYHAVVVATQGGWTSAPTAQVSVTTPTVLCL